MENRNIVTLVDEEGAEMRFEMLDVIEYETKKCYVRCKWIFYSIIEYHAAYC